MGSDHQRQRIHRYFSPISIHAPRRGSDRAQILYLYRASDFNPRSPQGERLTAIRPKEVICDISIHAPRMGSDQSMNAREGRPHKFQSTLPAWGATFVPYRLLWKHWISIHAPRMGSDNILMYMSAVNAISIHAPRMGSDVFKFHVSSIYTNFNPRSPHGERRPIEYGNDVATVISIHAPRMGSD